MIWNKYEEFRAGIFEKLGFAFFMPFSLTVLNVLIFENEFSDLMDLRILASIGLLLIGLIMIEKASNILYNLDKRLYCEHIRNSE